MLTIDLQLYGLVALLGFMLLTILMTIVLLSLDDFAVAEDSAEPTTLSLRPVKTDDH
jgi:hypothetical protein